MPVSKVRLLEKLAKRVNDEFAERLRKEFESKFNRAITTELHIFSGMLISRRVDGRPFNKAEAAWIDAWQKGYLQAIGVIDCAQIDAESAKR